MMLSHRGDALEVSKIIAEIDAQIAKLQQARALLGGGDAAKSRRGRPKGSKNVSAKSSSAAGSTSRKTTKER